MKLTHQYRASSDGVERHVTPSRHASRGNARKVRSVTRLVVRTLSIGARTEAVVSPIQWAVRGFESRRTDYRDGVLTGVPLIECESQTRELGN